MNVNLTKTRTAAVGLLAALAAVSATTACSVADEQPVRHLSAANGTAPSGPVPSGPVPSGQVTSGPAAPAKPSPTVSPGSPAAPKPTQAPAPKPTTLSPEAALAGVTYLAECLEDSLVQRPRTFTLTCADANQSLEGLTWSRWGAEQATATGRAVINTCTPSCAEGKDVTYPVRVVASRLVKGEASATYRKLTVTATGDRPAGVPKVDTFDLPGNTPGQGPEVMAP